MQKVGMNPIVINNNLQKPQVQPQPPVKTEQPVENTQNLQGANALANYNKPMVQQSQPAQPSLRTLHPTAPTKITKQMLASMPGERIYDSNGNLHSLVQKTPQTTITYKMTDDFVSSIKTIDNATGLLQKEEMVFYEMKDGKTSPKGEVLIDEYYPNSDKCMRSTYYDKEGNLKRVSENEYSAPDYRKCTSCHDGNYIVQESSKQGNYFNRTTYGADGQIKEVETADYDRHNWQLTTYENGVPKETKNHTKTLIQDAEAMNFKNDESLKPTAPFVMNYDPKQLPGERRYYSNGKEQSITVNSGNAEFNYYFDPDGKLTSVGEVQRDKDFSKDVMFTDNSYSIVEYMPGGKITKETTYGNDGSFYITHKDKDTNVIKSADYDEKGRIRYYREETYDNFKNIIGVEYDELGNVISIDKGEPA